MLVMNDDLESALKEYLKCLNEKEYFEAHEVLEEAWHPLRLQKHPLANLVKGLINAMISFEHIKRNRKNMQNKAQRVMASYERHKHLCTEEIIHYALFSEALVEVEILKIKHVNILNN